MENVNLYRNASVIYEMINNNEYLLLDTERGVFAGINQTCFQIWELLGEPKGYNELISELIIIYPDITEEELDSAVSEIIRNMVENGFVFYD